MPLTQLRGCTQAKIVRRTTRALPLPNLQFLAGTTPTIDHRFLRGSEGNPNKETTPHSTDRTPPFRGSHRKMMVAMMPCLSLLVFLASFIFLFKKNGRTTPLGFYAKAEHGRLQPPPPPAGGETLPRRPAARPGSQTPAGRWPPRRPAPNFLGGRSRGAGERTLPETYGRVAGGFFWRKQGEHPKKEMAVFSFLGVVVSYSPTTFF